MLYRLLMEHWGLHEPTCRNVLRAGVRKGNFKKLIAWYDQKEEIDGDLATAFHRELDRRPDLRETYGRLAEEIGYRRKHIPPEARRERDALIGKLRRLLRSRGDDGRLPMSWSLCSRWRQTLFRAGLSSAFT